MTTRDLHNMPTEHWPTLASEWDKDPIELMIKLRKHERNGWEPLDEPYVAKYSYGPIREGYYVQKLAKTGR